MHNRDRIMIVDDDPEARRNYRRILADRYDLLVVDNGLKGFEKLAVGNVDLALVDLKYPDTGCMEVLRQAPDHFPDVPIIFSSYSTLRQLSLVGNLSSAAQSTSRVFSEPSALAIQRSEQLESSRPMR